MTVGTWYKAEGNTWGTWLREVTFLATSITVENNVPFIEGNLSDGRTCKLYLEDWEFRELTPLEVALL
jgi:hypothetical protein